MSATLSHFASNQIEVATRDNNNLLSMLAEDLMPKVLSATIPHPEFLPVYGELLSYDAAWEAVDVILVNKEAARVGKTAIFEDAMEGISRKPNIDTNSPLESWDNVLIGVYAYGSPKYKEIMFRGREALTVGTYVDRLKALDGFHKRLAGETTKAALVALGVTVKAYYEVLADKRDKQNTAKAAVDTARTDKEAIRLIFCAKIFKMLGVGMQVFCEEPEKVDTLWDVNIIREVPQVVPGPPVDSTWNAGSLSMGATALPEGATGFELWRQGEGGMPERLAVGARGELSVAVPAEVTFDSGEVYEIWLQARNGKGSSIPGPKTSWTAPQGA